MLRVLEVGVLQTSADWGLMNDDAGAISQVSSWRDIFLAWAAQRVVVLTAVFRKQLR
jgi:hypothetical protein